MLQRKHPHIPSVSFPRVNNTNMAVVQISEVEINVNDGLVIS
jgi:hypothetical protein